MSAPRSLPLALLLAACPPDTATESTATPGTTTVPGSTSEPASTASTASTDTPTTTGGPQLTGETVASSESGASESSESSGSSSGESGEPATCKPDEGTGGTAAWTRDGDGLPPRPHALALTPTDQIVVVGSDWFPPRVTGAAVITAHDEQGEPVWSRTYEGAAGLRDEAIAVSVDAAGHVDVLVREPVFQGEHEGKIYGDVRLVVLRHAPDGTPLWRWERTREPTDPGVNYNPQGWLRSVDGGVRVLELSQGALTLLTIDSDGQTSAEVPLLPPDGLVGLLPHLGAGGVPLLGGVFGNKGPAWLGRYTSDGAVAWSTTIDEHASPNAIALADDGRLALAWNGAHMDVYGVWLSVYTPRGELDFVVQMPSDSKAVWPRVGGFRCDGSLLFAGNESRGYSPAQKFMIGNELWVTRHAPGGAPQWRIEDGLDDTYSDAQLVGMVPTPDGDVLVLASYFFQPEVDDQSRPWLARLSGG